MYELTSRVKAPKVRKTRKCPPNVHTAFKEYAEAYKAVYGIKPDGFTYDKKTQFIRVGDSGGVSLKRLKELTRMLKGNGNALTY